MVFAAVWFYAPSPCLGCNCLPLGSALEQLERQDAVFSGSVIEIIMVEDELLSIKFDVIDVWKGVEGKEITVYTGSHDGICGYNFQMNKDYLVYANWNNEAKRLGIIGVSLCSRTRLLIEASEDLSELGTVVELITWGAIKLHFAKNPVNDQ